ncbi:acyl-CoA ligase (AMP-forming), exosortase A system-associated [Microlunatus antarcticus]|uniref:Acyl-CoA ligase (AMP-forming) (Exosortase A-associated) n=1 Tax=Microlunatus antarcticus TaxID=53388 RepID=A0A7W5P629_9ACTN|nr:acyl-CoA ligase (AMP-forming), exosortase A system-associated [Microlunatus antarcticus]MBB3326089.1 acyl-CoA ligase (AMP-forming) (exosortase A-associated) [Microlunatus antarcticus]
MRTNLHHLLQEAAAARPHAPAVTSKDVTVTYGELWQTCEAAAGGLEALGLRRGERVAVFLDKRVETVAAFFATSAAGAVFVPVNPVLKAAQVSYILGNCDVRVLVTSADRLVAVAGELAGCPALEHVVVVGDPERELPVIDANVTLTRWEKLLVPGVGATGPRPLDLDVAAIFYTSGSTGRPKGVVLSHRNLIVGAESVSTYLHNTADDVILSALPLSFDAGFSQVTTAFAVGAHLVLHNHLVATDIPRLVAKHRVTGLTAVPPLWLQVIGTTWPDGAADTLRYFANTGGRMPRTTLDRLRALFPGAAPYLMYGLTESFRSTYLDPAEVDRRPDSIGKAIPDAEILVVRPDGTLCEPGEPGELVHRGALVALGYWEDEAKTAERFKPVPGARPGWRAPELAVYSGDTVVADEEGFLYFVGRSDEMIKTSGYRVSPTEVEEAAFGTGLVADAVALGVPDERLGDAIALVVTPAVGTALEPKALITALRRELPLYMVPSRVVVRASMPRSPNGKYDRPLVREELLA